jgi:hypothetical protein
MTYFTAVVDETGKVASFADLYGLDRKLATALFGNAMGFPLPSPERKRPQAAKADAPAPVRPTSASTGIAGALQGFLGD